MLNLVIKLCLLLLLTSCDRSYNVNMHKSRLVHVDSDKELAFDRNLAIINKHNLNNNIIKLTNNSLSAEPIIVGDIIYGTDESGNVFAISLKTRKQIWKNNIGYSNRSGGILFHNDRLYITNGSRELIILDSVFGHELLRKQMMDVVNITPALSNNILLIQTINNQLFAYDIVNLTLLWMNDGGSGSVTLQNNIRPIIINPNKVLVSYSSGIIACINIKDGNVLWKYSISDLWNISDMSGDVIALTTPPLIDKGKIYIATSTGKLIKLNLSNGFQDWSKIIHNVQSMKIYGNNLFLTTASKQVAAISCADGSIVWVGDILQDSKKNKNIFLYEPIIMQTDANFVLNIIGSDGNLYLFENDMFNKLNKISLKGRKISENTQYFWLGSDEVVYIGEKNKLLIPNLKFTNK